MFWNPATMTDYPGITSSFVATGIFPEGSITPNPLTPTAIFGSSNGDDSHGVAAVAGYSAYQFNDMLWLGYSTNIPFRAREQARLRLGRASLWTLGEGRLLQRDPFGGL